MGAPLTLAILAMCSGECAGRTVLTRAPAVLIGDDEAKGNFVTFRDFDTGEQIKIQMVNPSLPELVKRLKELS